MSPFVSHRRTKCGQLFLTSYQHATGFKIFMLVKVWHGNEAKLNLNCFQILAGFFNFFFYFSDCNDEPLKLNS